MATLDWKSMSDAELGTVLGTVRGAERSAVPLSDAQRREGVEEVIRRHYDWVARLCAFRIGDRAQAFDCAQEVMIQVTKSIKNFDGRSELKTWIWTIAKRVLYRAHTIERLRRLRFPGFSREEYQVAEDTADTQSGNETTETLMVRAEENRTLLQLIRQLPTQQQHAVLFHYFEDLSLAETAIRLGCSESTIKAHLFRARKRLGSWLQEKMASAPVAVKEI